MLVASDLSPASSVDVLTQLIHPLTEVVNLCRLKGVQLVRPWNNIEHTINEKHIKEDQLTFLYSEIRYIQSTIAFKTALKTHLFHSYCH